MMTRSFRRALYAVAAPVLLLGGCRGVIGIEALDVVADAGGGAGVDAGKDVVVGVETGSDAPAVPEIDAGCQTSAGMACGKCCRMAAVLMPAFGKLDMLAKENHCICGAGACTATTECANDVCAGTSSNPPCGGCVDMSIHPMPPATASAECVAAETACMNDSVCKAAIACQQSCNHP